MHHYHHIANGCEWFVLYVVHCEFTCEKQLSNFFYVTVILSNDCTVPSKQCTPCAIQVVQFIYIPFIEFIKGIYLRKFRPFIPIFITVYRCVVYTHTFISTYFRETYFTDNGYCNYDIEIPSYETFFSFSVPYFWN